MSDLDSRIPDDRLAEVLAEAARLHTEANKGYSLTDLQQVCLEAQIPPHIVGKAVRNIEEKRLCKQTERRQLREYIKQSAKRGISVGIMLLIPAIAVSSLFIFRSQFEPLVASLVSRFNPQPPSQESPNPTSSEPQITPEPGVILLEDFRNKVMGKTQEGVKKEVGRKPDSAHSYSHEDRQFLGWKYENIKESVSGKVGTANVMFKKRVVDHVDFTSY